MVQYKETQYMRNNIFGRLIILLIIVLALFLLLNTFLTRTDTLGKIIIILLLLGLLALFIMIKLEYEITENVVGFRFYPFQLKKKEILIKDIAKISLIKYHSLKDFGGWGIRIKGSTTVYNIYGNHGILLELKNNDKIILGTQKYIKN